MPTQKCSGKLALATYRSSTSSSSSVHHL